MACHSQFLVRFFLLTLFCRAQGLQVSMDRTPGHHLCGRLHCWQNVGVFTNVEAILGMKLFEGNIMHTESQLASLYLLEDSIMLNTSKANGMKGRGSISRFTADLTLDFYNETDCENGTFMCELFFINKYGQIELIQQTVEPGNSNVKMKEELVSRLKEEQAIMREELSERFREEQTSIKELAERLTKEQNKTNEELTAKLNKERFGLSEELNVHNDKLHELNKEQDELKNKLTELSEELTGLKNRLKELKKETLTEKNTTVREEMDNVVYQVTDIQSCLSFSQDTKEKNEKPVMTTCTRGMSLTYPRTRVMLWGYCLALCDTDGGGWIVIQRHTKGDVSFYRNWTDYKNGFGTPYTNFWIGNNVIHNLTSQGYNELRIDMELEGRKYFAHYSHFSVGDEVSRYKLSVSGYSGGTANDSLTYHDGMKFSTPDQDNDLASGDCAGGWESAWWYKACYYSNLNGVWGKNDDSGVLWSGVNTMRSLSSTEMKIRHV